MIYRHGDYIDFYIKQKRKGCPVFFLKVGSGATSNPPGFANRAFKLTFCIVLDGFLMFGSIFSSRSIPRMYCMSRKG